LIFGGRGGIQEGHVEKAKSVVDIASGMRGEIIKTGMRKRMLHSTSPVFIPTNHNDDLITVGSWLEPYPSNSPGPCHESRQTLLFQGGLKEKNRCALLPSER
jgi:hypothetical protein